MGKVVRKFSLKEAEGVLAIGRNFFSQAPANGTVRIAAGQEVRIEAGDLEVHFTRGEVHFYNTERSTNGTCSTPGRKATDFMINDGCNQLRVLLEGDTGKEKVTVSLQRLGGSSSALSTGMSTGPLRRR